MCVLSASILRSRCGRNFWCLWWRGRGRSPRKKIFAATLLLFGNNNAPKFQLHLQFFAHATLLNRVFTRSSKRPANVQLHYNIWQQTSSKLPALRLLEVCWTFAGSCKHPKRLGFSRPVFWTLSLFLRVRMRTQNFRIFVYLWSAQLFFIGTNQPCGTIFPREWFKSSFKTWLLDRDYSQKMLSKTLFKRHVINLHFEWSI